MFYNRCEYGICWPVDLLSFSTARAVVNGAMLKSEGTQAFLVLLSWDAASKEEEVACADQGACCCSSRTASGSVFVEEHAAISPYAIPGSSCCCPAGKADLLGPYQQHCRSPFWLTHAIHVLAGYPCRAVYSCATQPCSDKQLRRSLCERNDLDTEAYLLQDKAEGDCGPASPSVDVTNIQSFYVLKQQLHDTISHFKSLQASQDCS